MQLDLLFYFDLHYSHLTRLIESIFNVNFDRLFLLQYLILLHNLLYIVILI